MKMVREEELLPIISDNIDAFGKNLYQIYQLKSGFGIADIVFYNLDKKVIANRKVQNIDPIDSYDIIRILTTLNHIDFDTISLTFLKQALPCSSKNRDEIVSYLIENGFLIPRDRTSFSKGNKYQIGLQEVVAVEAKLSNWQRGLYQAYRYKEYANKSYLALYERYLHRALKHIDDFIRFNVGLVEVSNSSIYIHYEPKPEPTKQNVFSALVFEQLFGTQKHFFPNV